MEGKPIIAYGISHLDSGLNPDVAICTLMHNDYEFIDDYVEGIRRASERIGFRFEVLVYFWDCEKKFVDLVSELLSRISNIELKICEGKNIGFSRGCNLLASYTQAKILLFLNPDTLLVSFNVESIIKFYNDKVIIGPLQVNSIDELNDLDEAQLNRRYLSNDFFYYPVNLSNPKSQTYIDGAALIIPRDYFNELGGFDENIFIFQDDMDLCLRCLNSGGVLVNITDSVVYHYSGGTVKGGYRKDGSDRHETSRLRRHHAEKNQIYLAHKYLPRFTFCTWLLLWCALNIVGSSILFISNEKWLAGSPWISLYDFTRDLLRGKYKQNSCHLNWYVKRKFQFLPGKVSVFLDLGVPTSKS